MGKIAFVFSGQGDQYPGMGKNLYENYPTAKRIFDLCEELRPQTLDQCFQGTNEELKETKNTQPCLFAMELAAAYVMMEKGVIPEAVAGFSLGEVTAAAVSGLFDERTGFEIVCRRGELMQIESEKNETFMAAVLKLSSEQLEDLCKNYENVYPVNFNCPGQISVAGLASEMTGFFADVKAMGGRALPLKVKGAFHSPFMKDASDAFADVLACTALKQQHIPLYSNVTGKMYDGDAVSLLSKQICHPVQWEETIRNMIKDGVDQFVEIGPGKTLINMIKKIDKEIYAVSFEDMLLEVEKC